MTQAPPPQRTIRALIATGDDNIQELVESVLTDATKGHASLEVHAPRSTREKALRDLARRFQFDVFTVTLNNVLYPATERDPLTEKLQSSVALVRDLVQLYSKPVVGIYGWPDGPEYPDRVIEAGAAAVLRMPFKRQQLRDAITDALALAP